LRLFGGKSHFSKEAFMAYKRAAELYEQDTKKYVENQKIMPTIYNNLGLFYFDRQQYADANRYFEQGLAISPNDVVLLVNCAMSLHELERFKVS
jgi:tetratricopeptide (TPR) repeat protein